MGWLVRQKILRVMRQGPQLQISRPAICLPTLMGKVGSLVRGSGSGYGVVLWYTVHTAQIGPEPLEVCWIDRRHWSVRLWLKSRIKITMPVMVSRGCLTAVAIVLASHSLPPPLQSLSAGNPFFLGRDFQEDLPSRLLDPSHGVVVPGPEGNVLAAEAAVDRVNPNDTPAQQRAKGFSAVDCRVSQRRRAGRAHLCQQRSWPNMC